MSPVCFSGFFSSFWTLKLQSEVEFTETLLTGSLGLCLTMHNWALLLAYSHGCTLFSWNGQECKPHRRHHFSQPSLEDLSQTVTKCTRPAYQRGQAWHWHTYAKVDANTCPQEDIVLQILGLIGLNFDFLIWNILFLILFIWNILVSIMLSSKVSQSMPIHKFLMAKI